MTWINWTWWARLDKSRFSKVLVQADIKSGSILKCKNWKIWDVGNLLCFPYVSILKAFSFLMWHFWSFWGFFFKFPRAPRIFVFTYRKQSSLFVGIIYILMEIMERRDDALCGSTLDSQAFSWESECLQRFMCVSGRHLHNPSASSLKHRLLISLNIKNTAVIVFDKQPIGSCKKLDKYSIIAASFPSSDQSWYELQAFIRLSRQKGLK